MLNPTQDQQALYRLLLLIDATPEPDAERDKIKLADKCSQWAMQERCQITVMYPTSLADFEHALSSAATQSYDGILINPGRWANHLVWPALAHHITVPLIQVRPETKLYQQLAADVLTAQSAYTIFGRGEKSYRWAIRHARNRLSYPFQTVAYGEHESQVGDLRIPEGHGPFPVCVLLHGGFWRPFCKKDMTDNLAVALTQQGFVTWNVDYRVNGDGGGYPNTFEDVRMAISFVKSLASLAPIDTENVCVLGHSAGGQLALSAVAPVSSEALLSPLQVGVRACVSLAGILDMSKAWEDNSGEGAVAAIMGDQLANVHRVSPMQLPTPDMPVLLAHGLKDDTVPPEHSLGYYQRLMQAHSPSELLLFEEADHMDIVKTQSAAWTSVEGWLLGQVKTNKDLYSTGA